MTHLKHSGTIFDPLYHPTLNIRHRSVSCDPAETYTQKVLKEEKLTPERLRLLIDFGRRLVDKSTNS